MTDRTDEAKAIRDALAELGWNYIGGGPYPDAPRMRFRSETSREVLVVQIEPGEESK